MPLAARALHGRAKLAAKAHKFLFVLFVSQSAPVRGEVGESGLASALLLIHHCCQPGFIRWPLSGYTGSDWIACQFGLGAKLSAISVNLIVRQSEAVDSSDPRSTDQWHHQVGHRDPIRLPWQALCCLTMDSSFKIFQVSLQKPKDYLSLLPDYGL